MWNNSIQNKSKELQKYINWLDWLSRRFQRTKLLVDTDSCAYGNTQLVSSPKQIGGGWMFYSKGCSGCQISRENIELFKRSKNMPTNARCAMLLGPLFSHKEIKEGQEVTLPLVVKLNEEDEE